MNPKTLKIFTEVMTDSQTKKNQAETGGLWVGVRKSTSLSDKNKFTVLSQQAEIDKQFFETVGIGKNQKDLFQLEKNRFLLMPYQAQKATKNQTNSIITFQLFPETFFQAESMIQKIENVIDFSCELSRSLLKLDQIKIDLTALEILNRDLDLPFKVLFSAWVEGLYLGAYHFDECKGSGSLDASKKNSKKTISLILDSYEKLSASECSKILEEKEIITDAIAKTRDLVNRPPNILDSETYTEWTRNQVQQLRQVKSLKSKVSFSVMNQAQLKAKGMNSILAVNAGSRKEAKLLELEYRPVGYKEKIDKTVLLVGKGVTFDSGGLSLKPSKAMDGMKMDMAGSAAVLNAFFAVVQLQLGCRVVVLTPLTDNLTGENAFKVGDVITTYSGKTVEVLNTDAEGRLILADSLSYGVKKYRADYVVDLATLTGACMVALGVYYAGLFSNDEKLIDLLLTSSKNTGERLWPLPLDSFYLKELESPIADLKNIGSAYGGASTAAKFLEQFITLKDKEDKNNNKKKSTTKVSWAHLDIAPVMSASATKGRFFQGATGFGVSLLVDWIKQLSRNEC